MTLLGTLLALGALGGIVFLVMIIGFKLFF